MFLIISKRAQNYKVNIYFPLSPCWKMCVFSSSCWKSWKCDCGNFKTCLILKQCLIFDFRFWISIFDSDFRFYGFPDFFVVDFFFWFCFLFNNFLSFFVNFFENFCLFIYYYYYFILFYFLKFFWTFLLLLKCFKPALMVLVLLLKLVLLPSYRYQNWYCWHRYWYWRIEGSRFWLLEFPNLEL